jgi:hypothetical protein
MGSTEVEYSFGKEPESVDGVLELGRLAQNHEGDSYLKSKISGCCRKRCGKKAGRENEQGTD